MAEKGIGLRRIRLIKRRVQNYQTRREKKRAYLTQVSSYTSSVFNPPVTVAVIFEVANTLKKCEIVTGVNEGLWCSVNSFEKLNFFGGSIRRRNELH